MSCCYLIKLCVFKTESGYVDISVLTFLTVTLRLVFLSVWILVAVACASCQPGHCLFVMGVSVFTCTDAVGGCLGVFTNLCGTGAHFTAGSWSCDHVRRISVQTTGAV